MATKKRLMTAATCALVADDDPIMRSLMKARLGEIVDTVVEATDGFEAWRLLTAERFQLAVVDLMMPNLNGIALIQCIRGHARTRHMPVVVVTSNNDRHSLDEALRVGASAILTKPLAWSVFKTHIQHLMRLSATSEQAVIDLSRARQLATAQRAFAAAAAAASHARFCRLAAQASGSGDPAMMMAQLGDCARAGALASERLEALQALVGSDAIVNHNAHACGMLVGSAIAIAGEMAQASGATLASTGVPDVDVVCSRDAIILALVSLMRVVAMRNGPGTRLGLDAVADPGGLGITIAWHRGSGAPLQLSDLALDLAAASQMAETPDAFDIAVARTFVEAHGGSLALQGEHAVEQSLVLHLPVDRLRAVEEGGAARLSASTAA